MLTDVPRRLIENGTISGGAAWGFVICKMCFTLSAVSSGRAASRLLRLLVRIPPRAWMFVVSVVLSGRGLCGELITRPEESYRLWCVVECDLETS
jgi:hypothetical protein